MPETPIQLDKFSLLEHLTELRQRLFRILLLLFVTTVFCGIFVDHLFEIVLAPILPYVPRGDLVTLSPLEHVVVYLKIAVIFGFMLSMPFVLHQLWGFISPGLYVHEKRFVFPFIFLGTLFFCGGVAFGFFLILPTTFKFLLSTLPAHVIPQYSLEKYVTLCLHLLLAMGIIFEIPLILSVLVVIGILDVKTLKKYRRYAIIGAFVVSAFITPTVDPYSQALTAVPMIVFYELAVVFAWLFNRRNQKKTLASYT